MRKSFLKKVIFVLFLINIFILPILSQNRVVIDGNILPDEYSNKFNLDNSNFILYISIVNDIVYFGIETTLTGWVSIGIDPSSKMKDADMIICNLINDKANIYDQFSTGIFGPHKDDTSLGGTFDILSFAGKKYKDKIFYEFSRKNDTKDLKDKPIYKNKDIKIIWAYSNSSDIDSKHSKKGSTIINIKN